MLQNRCISEGKGNPTVSVVVQMECMGFGRKERERFFSYSTDGFVDSLPSSLIAKGALCNVWALSSPIIHLTLELALNAFISGHNCQWKKWTANGKWSNHLSQTLTSSKRQRFLSNWKNVLNVYYTSGTVKVSPYHESWEFILWGCINKCLLQRKNRDWLAWVTCSPSCHC